MSDDEPETGSDTDTGPTVGDGAASEDESGTEIPISTGEDGNDSTNDPTDRADDASEDVTTDEGIEIEVETGSPGPDVERRSREDTGIGFGDSGGPGTGMFDRLDESIVSLLSRVLDTETHLRVYVALRGRPWSTSDEIAEETGLYPRTVRDALGALEARGAATRRRAPGGTGRTDATAATSAAGNGSGDDRDGDSGHEPEYAAVAPSAVLTDAVGASGRGLPEGLDLDRYLGSEPTTDASGPVRINVEDGPEQRSADERGAAGGEGDGGDETDGHDGNETN